MNQTPYIIAVDGPAGAGKSAVCSDVARELGILHLDTGACLLYTSDAADE